MQYQGKVLENKSQILTANSEGETATVQLQDNRTKSAIQKKVFSSSGQTIHATSAVVQRVTLEDLKENRDLSIFYRTLTSATVTREQTERYLQVIHDTFPEYIKNTNLSEIVAKMSVDAFKTFHTAEKLAAKPAVRMGVKGIRDLARQSVQPEPVRKIPSGFKLKPLSKAPQLPVKDVVATSGKKVLAPITKVPHHPPIGVNKTADFRIRKGPVAKATTGGQVDRLEADGVEPMGALPWTHNTSAHGLLGVLTTGQFLSTVERNVNFRYDLDSRYHQGVSVVMRPQLEWCWDGSHVHDLYHQSEHLRGADQRVSEDSGRRVFTKQAGQSAKDDHANPRLNKMREHLDTLTELSDFRDTQLGKLGKGGKLKHTDSKAATHANYGLSLVNPQLRVPVEQPVGFSHIDFVIITKEVDAVLKKWEAGVGIAEVEKGTKDFLKKQRVEHNKSLPSSVKMGIARLAAMRKQGKIHVVDGSGYSHKAGRVDKRSKKDNEDMETAAGQGLEHGDDYFHPEVNNSPSALDMATFLQFQEAYYSRLAKKDGHRAQKIAAEILKRRGMPVPKGVPGDGKGEVKKGKILSASLINGPDRAHRLSAFRTEADGSCGIHAMLGNAGDDGVVRHDNPQALRNQLANRIANREVNMGRYGTMIRELIREIITKLNKGTALTADERLLFDSFKHEAGFGEIARLFDIESDAFNELGAARDLTETAIARQVKSVDAVHFPLQNYLIAEIIRSNGKGDAVAKARLLRGRTEAERRFILRNFSIDYLKKTIVENRDGVIACLQMDANEEGERYAANRHAGNQLRGQIDTATDELYNAHINNLLIAYSHVVTNGAYYLREEDLRELADIQNRNLVIYRRGERGTYHEHVRHNVLAPAGPDMPVFHSGAHYEQAHII